MVEEKDDGPTVGGCVCHGLVQHSDAGMVREMVEDLSELALMKAEMFGMREMVVEVDKVNDDLGKSSRLMVDQVLREIRIKEAVRRQEVWRSMRDVEMTDVDVEKEREKVVVRRLVQMRSNEMYDPERDGLNPWETRAWSEVAHLLGKRKRGGKTKYRLKDKVIDMDQIRAKEKKVEVETMEDDQRNTEGLPALVEDDKVQDNSINQRMDVFPMEVDMETRWSM